jgi:acyl carrier protein
MDCNEKVKNALFRIGVDMDLVQPFARLDTELDINSTEAVELVSLIKRFTGVSISSYWCKEKTVQELVDYVANSIQA